jgi:hypothetical protein
MPKTKTTVPGNSVRPGALITPGGERGLDGAQGQVVCSPTATTFIIPEVGATALVDLEQAIWVVIGQWINIELGGGEVGPFQVINKIGNQLELLNAPASEGVSGPPGPPSFPDAPVDDQLYGRKNEAWEVIPAGGGGGGSVTGDHNLGHPVPDSFVTSTGLTMGVRFSVSENGYLKEVSWYKGAQEASYVNHSFIIWDDAGVPIWNSPPDSDPATEGWISHRFAIPMPLNAGNYTLGVYAAQGYGIDSTYVFPYVDGPLTATGGCWVAGNGYPNSEAVDCYGFDLVFGLSLSTGGETPIADDTQDGLLRQVSGLTTDFVDGTNNCQDLATAVEALGIGGGGGGVSYSTNEQDTGLTWIDGKVIYQKTIDFGVLPDNGYKELAHNIVGLDQYIDIRGVIKSGSYFYTIPPASLVLSNQIDLYLDGWGIYVMTNTAWNAATAFFTLQYTLQ